jgi:carbamoylphosphate synthase large subunit
MEETEFPTAKRRLSRTLGRKRKRLSKLLVIRPNYSPKFYAGGTGGGTAFNPEEFEDIAKTDLPNLRIRKFWWKNQYLGWKEFELEVMR